MAVGKKAVKSSELNRTYAYPLPIIIEDPQNKQSTSLVGLWGSSRSRTITPHCEAFFDAHTKSVWVIDSSDSMLLWRRGFFGKGNLSRSEPNWLNRERNRRKAEAAGVATAEEVTARRRADRKQFKLDRAQALAAAAAEAEAAFAATGAVPTESAVVIPSSSTWRPLRTDTPLPPGDDENAEVAEVEELTEDMEHLQLTLEEAFFLLWSFDCLTVLDPATHGAMGLPQIWLEFQGAHQLGSPDRDLYLGHRFDNPFLIKYAVYHHYRSLGWVVKIGLKFCVDYLLYKRGPVFHHAEFALVVCPVYEDPADRETSPFYLENSEPFSWSWLSTINRVNSQVHKTLILVYVTIPAMSRITLETLASPACFAHYSVKEVVLRRFIPAHNRD